MRAIITCVTAAGAVAIAACARFESLNQHRRFIIATAMFTPKRRRRLISLIRLLFSSFLQRLLQNGFTVFAHPGGFNCFLVQSRQSAR